MRIIWTLSFSTLCTFVKLPQFILVSLFFVLCHIFLYFILIHLHPSSALAPRSLPFRAAFLTLATRSLPRAHHPLYALKIRPTSQSTTRSHPSLEPLAAPLLFDAIGSTTLAIPLSLRSQQRFALDAAALHTSTTAVATLPLSNTRSPASTAPHSRAATPPLGIHSLKHRNIAQCAKQNTPIKDSAPNPPIIGIEALLNLVALSDRLQAANQHPSHLDQSSCLNTPLPPDRKLPFTSDLAPVASPQSSTTSATDLPTSRTSARHRSAPGGDQ